MYAQDFRQAYIGIVEASVVFFLALPALKYASKTLTGGVGQPEEIGGLYEDCDSVATKDSITAYSDNRPRTTTRLASAFGLCVSLASVLAVTRHSTTRDASGLGGLAIEPICWVGRFFRFVVLFLSSSRVFSPDKSNLLTERDRR